MSTGSQSKPEDWCSSGYVPFLADLGRFHHNFGTENSLQSRDLYVNVINPAKVLHSVTSTLRFLLGSLNNLIHTSVRGKLGASGQKTNRGKGNVCGFVRV